MALRILLTGKNGQVGRELESRLPCLGELVALDHHQLDVADAEGIRRTVRDLQPNLIVNAAGYTAVDQAETDQEAAQAVNADAPALIAEEAKRIGAALIHYSTDYVFDGGKSAPYEEDDEPNPVNVYGRTKLAGERAVQAAGVPHLIFRTTWVYATRGRNFLLTFLRLASQREELGVVKDQIGAPTWSRMIAVGTSLILARICSTELWLSRLRESSGVYHLTAAGKTSWYDLARAILEECSDSSKLGPWFTAATGGQPLAIRRVVPISTSEYPTPALRPAYSVLSNTKLLRTFNLQLPHWRTQLHLAFCDATVDDLPHIATTGSL